uniref:Uncharacterized protein n=1 Tax=Sphaerodactylus townsendi TaxID=933632 RepID=A0ACB8GA09_9SAUR
MEEQQPIIIDQEVRVLYSEGSAHLANGEGGQLHPPPKPKEERRAEGATQLQCSEDEMARPPAMTARLLTFCSLVWLCMNGALASLSKPTILEAPSLLSIASASPCSTMAFAKISEHSVATCAFQQSFSRL